MFQDESLNIIHIVLASSCRSRKVEGRSGNVGSSGKEEVGELTRLRLKVCFAGLVRSIDVSARYRLERTRRREVER